MIMMVVAMASELFCYSAVLFLSEVQCREIQFILLSVLFLLSTTVLVVIGRRRSERARNRKDKTADIVLCFLCPAS